MTTSGIVVDLVIHYRIGSEVRTATLGGVAREVAEKTINGLDRSRAANGFLTISDQSGHITTAIPVQNIELVVVEEVRWAR